uniref:Uncharacterized protein n=1 Tax=Anguilla anguilla TaxID=7936 RepID=A0A0E9X0U9_ANGAN
MCAGLAGNRCEWEKYAWISQVTRLRGLIIDPFGGKNDSALKRAPSSGDGKFMKQAFVKFKRINMSILLHLRARWALKVQRLIISALSLCATPQRGGSGSALLPMTFLLWVVGSVRYLFLNKFTKRKIHSSYLMTILKKKKKTFH